MHPRVLLFAVAAILWSQNPSAQGITPPEGMVFVPAGEFVMGSEEGHADEAPVRRVYVSAFFIDRNEVTTRAFAEFARRNGFGAVEGPWFRYSAEGCINLIAHYEAQYGVLLKDFAAARAGGQSHQGRLLDAARWRAAAAALRVMMPEGWVYQGPTADVATTDAVRKLVRDQAGLPVRGVTWRDAETFARWAGKRLPTEAEWEKAARGTDARRYPWGGTWDEGRCRVACGSDGGPVTVGSFPKGASPYGCLDMAGNVWEWIADWYGEDYYASASSAVDPSGPEGLARGELPRPSPGDDLLRSTRQGRESDTRKVIRGGGWAGPESQARFNARCPRRMWSNPSYWHPDVGFRCAKDIE